MTIKDNKGTNYGNDFSWYDISWKNVDFQVKRLRCRIFKYSKEGNYKKLRQLQRLMVHSKSNLLVSVRRVTSISKGRKTPGIEKIIALNPVDRMKLVNEIAGMDLRNWVPLTVKRLFILKANKKLRPLGIPTIKDRVIQAIIKNALEPEWEAKFEPTSFGFRPGKTYHDAMHRLHTLLSPKDRLWVVEGNIKGCFDSINHKYLLDTIGGFPYKDLIEKWLKAGVLFEGVFFETVNGTPQGSVMSALLANIALHGIEKDLNIKSSAQNSINKRENPLNRTIIRFANDFVVLCPSLEISQKTVSDLKAILAKRGLLLNDEKTKITNTFDGFDFLGFNVRHVLKLGHKHRYIGDLSKGISGEFANSVSTLIVPSDKCLSSIKARISSVFRDNRGKSAFNLISTLNPIIRGYCESKRTFPFSQASRSLQHFLFLHIMAWLKRKHPKKSTAWVVSKYFIRYRTSFIDSNWTFRCPFTGMINFQFIWFSSSRFWPPVFGNASPDDPELVQYWIDRQSKLFSCKVVDMFSNFDRMLAESQGLMCPICSQSLFSDSQLHRHHIVPKKDGGTDKASNLVLVHLHCHHHLHYGKSESEWSETLKLYKVNNRIDPKELSIPTVEQTMGVDLAD